MVGVVDMEITKEDVMGLDVGEYANELKVQKASLPPLLSLQLTFLVRKKETRLVLLF